MPNGIGEQLREERAARGIALAEVEAQTKIRARFLRAMEEEDWDVLPGAAYARAFLHTYAEVLGLDADEVVAQYRRIEQPTEEQPAIAPVPESTISKPEGPALPGAMPRVPRPRGVGLAAIAVVAVVGIVLVIGLATGSDDDGGPAGNRTRAGSGEGSGGSAPAPAPEPEQVSVKLTTTGTVWVCLVDQAGRPVVEGLTLPAGEEQGPFHGRSFEIGLGNGQVELLANGDPVEVPAVANPVGYRITPEGTRELDEADRPTCA